VYRLHVVVLFKRGILHLLAYWKPSGPNLLDEPLEGFIVNPVDVSRKGAKRLATSNGRVNHDKDVQPVQSV